MNIEAKPPVRRNSGAGAIVVVVVAAAVCVPLLIVAFLTFSWFFARSGPETQVVYAPAYEVPDYRQISPDFEARLNAANRIQLTSERDAALAVLVAEFSNKPAEAERAIQGIQDSVIRDTAAWDAARRFSKLNRSQEAMKMIESIVDSTARDAGFRAVATGDWPERTGIATTIVTEAAAEETIEAATATVTVEQAEEIVVVEEAEDTVTEAAEEVVEAEVVEEEVEESAN